MNTCVSNIRITTEQKLKYENDANRKDLAQMRAEIDFDVLANLNKNSSNNTSHGFDTVFNCIVICLLIFGGSCKYLKYLLYCPDVVLVRCVKSIRTWTLIDNVLQVFSNNIHICLNLVCRTPILAQAVSHETRHCHERTIHCRKN